MRMVDRGVTERDQLVGAFLGVVGKTQRSRFGLSSCLFLGVKRNLVSSIVAQCMSPYGTTMTGSM